MMKRYIALVASTLLIGAGCKQPSKTAATTKDPGGKAPASKATKATKPAAATPAASAGLLDEPPIWTTVAEVKQGCDARLASAEAIKKTIAAAAGKRDLQNTLVPFNNLLIEIDRIQPLSELIANVHPEKPVRTAAEKCEARAKKFISALKLDRAMYDALKGVPDAGLDPLARRFRDHLLRDYRRAGVDRDEATRKKLADLQERLVKLGQTFDRTIREDKPYIEVTAKQLAGLPQDFVDARQKKAGPGNKIRITTDYPDFYPVQSYAQDESVRRGIFIKRLSRAYPANAKVLKQILAARYEYAKTLGYPDWAEYNAEDKMVKRKKVIADFLAKVVQLSRPRMEADRKEILARKRKENPKAKAVQGWDRFYFVKKIQAERFGVDPNEVRAYFDFTRVKKGLLDLSQEMFGLTFKRAPGAKVWHPSVEVYDVHDGAKKVARFYLDLHPREGKYGHAAEFPIISGIDGVQLPAASLVTNFPDPSKTGGGPALTEHNQVTTFFHEFGHLMHQLLAGIGQRWVTQAGINCEWDFVEAPSQLLEEWTWDAAVLQRFARHHKTNQPIPAELVEKMRKANEFGKGMHVMRQMYYAHLSFLLHDRDPKDVDLLKVTKEVWGKYSPYRFADGTAPFASFGHLNGYSSMYYTYMWSLVLAKDLFTRFEGKLMDKATARAYRKAVLEPGGSVDAVEMVKAFLGRPYSFDAFEKYLKQGV